MRSAQSLPLILASGAFALAALISSPAVAQQPAPAPDRGAQASATPDSPDAKPRFMPPGMMMGPGTISEAGMERLCDPRSAGFSGWRIAQFERGLELSEEQKQKLDNFKTASAKALDTMITACPKSAPLTPTGRLEMMENELTARLDAVKALRAAFDPFYASLTDEQKARLTVDSRGHGWRWQAARGRDWR